MEHDDDAPSRSSRRRSGSVSDQEFAVPGADADSEVEEDSEHLSIDAKEIAGMNNSTIHRSPNQKGLLSSPSVSQSLKKVKSNQRATALANQSSERKNNKKAARRSMVALSGKQQSHKHNLAVDDAGAEVSLPDQLPADDNAAAMYAYPKRENLNQLPFPTRKVRKQSDGSSGGSEAVPSGTLCFIPYAKPKTFFRPKLRPFKSISDGKNARGSSSLGSGHPPSGRIETSSAIQDSPSPCVSSCSSYHTAADIPQINLNNS